MSKLLSVLLLKACVFYVLVELRAGFQWGNLREGDHLKDLGVDGRILLKWVLDKWDGA